MQQSFFRWLVISAALGFVAPIGWYLIQALVGGNARLEWEIAYPLERALRVIWPSSFWLLATNGIEGTPKAYLFTFLAVSSNVIVYAVLGTTGWLVKYLATAKR